ncbi:hypothetical protein N599_30695 [Saccharopolyspora erythraea D]|nr:hypothetical protein N599_30695 [Saccharopolyspora erythraea D]
MWPRLRVFDRASLASTGARRPARSSVIDVEVEDFRGAGGGLIRHPVQRLLPDRDLAARYSRSIANRERTRA